MKAKYVILMLVVVIVALLVYGVRFSSEAGIIRHIPFSEIEAIPCSFWKYSDGETNIGGIIVFNENTTIRNDTLCINNMPVGIIARATKRYLTKDYELVIERLSDRKPSYYIAK